jgi:hypothetical protein
MNTRSPKEDKELDELDELVGEVIHISPARFSRLESM